MLALLFTVGIGGAALQKIHAAPKKLDQQYSWNNGDFTGSIADARDHYDCPAGTAVTCATGTAPNLPTVTIKKP